MSEANGSTRQRRQFTADEKATILRRHLADKVAVSDLCDEYHIQPSLFYLWQRQALENLSAALQDGRALRGQTQAAAADRTRIAPWRRGWRGRMRSSPKCPRSISP